MGIFGIAGVEGAEIDAAVRINIPRIGTGEALARAVIFVPAEFEVVGDGHAGGRRIEIRGWTAVFEVVDAAPVRVIRVGNDEAHRVARAETKAAGDAAFPYGRAAQRLDAAAERAFQQVVGAARHCARQDVDDAAQAFRIDVGRERFDDLHPADDPRRKRVERDGAAAALRRRRIRSGQPHAVEGRAVEVGVHAADVDEAAFARVGLERDARNALHRFGDVDVGQLLDFVGKPRSRTFGAASLICWASVRVAVTVTVSCPLWPFAPEPTVRA